MVWHPHDEQLRYSETGARKGAGRNLWSGTEDRQVYQGLDRRRGSETGKVSKKNPWEPEESMTLGHEDN